MRHVWGFFLRTDAFESDQCGSDCTAAVGLHRRGAQLLRQGGCDLRSRDDREDRQVCREIQRGKSNMTSCWDYYCFHFNNKSLNQDVCINDPLKSKIESETEPSVKTI